ncbi:hypothetical protein [Actinopolymorpha sp. B9G3]|uniref:hypothetical protein n=1 Tax=Actinopolymorpha sp. B9G3 TaxID=3158970 RepID=UPI0032D8B8AD
MPVIDAEPTRLVLAWPEGSRSRALATLVRAAARVAASHDGSRPRSGYAASR